MSHNNDDSIEQRQKQEQPEQDPGNTEQRRSPRLPLEAIVHYQIGGSEFVNLSSNVSSEGIFIKNFSPPPVGTELRIKINLSQELGGGPVQLRGKVVHVVDNVGIEARGMGVEFTSIQADSPDAIKMFVSQVYETADEKPRQVEKDRQSGKWAYQPGPEDLLRLQGDRQPRSGSLVSIRLLPVLALVLVGILLAGGLFFLLSMLN